jgi:hypothetical protein
MANLPELNEFTEGVYQIETSDPVLGGVDGITNVPIKALANRTKWLKAQVEAIEAAVEAAIDAAYVQAELNKLPFKAPARVATTTNITLSGLQTIDGVSVLAGERVLVKNQSTASQNGIWLAQTSAWTRAADMNEDAEVVPGMAVVVSGGTLQGDTIWTLSTDGTITVGTSDMAFKNFTEGLATLASPAFTGNPTAPTQAQFNNTTRLATTEFVQRALGNESGVVIVAANRIMTAADAGKYLFTNANSVVYTLPDPAGLALGTKFRITQGNLTSGGSINAPGSVTIGNITDGGTVSSVSLAQSTEYVLTVVSATAYQITRISAGGAFTQSIAANGWQRLPSGLIIQWGRLTSGIATGNNSVTLPIAFPNAVFSAAVAEITNDAWSQHAGWNQSASTLSTLVFHCSDTEANNSSVQAFSWIAIGH